MKHHIFIYKLPIKTYLGQKGCITTYTLTSEYGQNNNFLICSQPIEIKKTRTKETIPISCDAYKFAWGNIFNAVVYQMFNYI